MNTSACAKLGKSEQIGKSHNYPGIMPLKVDYCKKIFEAPCEFVSFKI